MEIETNNGTLMIEFKEKTSKKSNIMKSSDFGFVDENIESFVGDDETFEKEDIETLEKTKLNNPTRFNTGQVAITMSTLDKPDIDQIANIDIDLCGYDRIRIFDSMERRANVTVINDGPDSIYLMINRNGIDHDEEAWAQNEIMIYPGEAWKLYDIYELRVRSETQGNKYRITEDDIITTSTIRSVM